MAEQGAGGPLSGCRYISVDRHHRDVSVDRHHRRTPRMPGMASALNAVMARSKRSSGSLFWLSLAAGGRHRGPVSPVCTARKRRALCAGSFSSPPLPSTHHPQKSGPPVKSCMGRPLGCDRSSASDSCDDGQSGGTERNRWSAARHQRTQTVTDSPPCPYPPLLPCYPVSRVPTRRSSRAPCASSCLGPRGPACRRARPAPVAPTPRCLRTCLCEERERM